MRIINLGSGSKGNSTLIEHGETRIIIDAGLSIKDMELRIVEAKCSMEKVNAILVSHNHIDHIRSVSRIANKYKIPVYASRECYEDPKLQKIIYEYKNEVGIEDFKIGEVLVSAFEVPHDALKTIGFIFYADGNKVVYVTDVGEITDNVFSKMVGANLVFIESNYDEKMLLTGPYPENLKRRIRSNMGHLSNSESAKNILNLARRGTKFFVLMHLSEINNTPEIAYNNVMNVLYDEYGEENDVRVFVSHQHKISSNFILKPKQKEQ